MLVSDFIVVEFIRFKPEFNFGLGFISGRLVKSLLDGPAEAGEHSIRWDGRSAAGRRAPAGVYLVRFRSEGFEATQRVSLVR